MSYERINDSKEFDGPVRDAHEWRYRFAARYIPEGGTVLDAGCGTGYGERVMRESVPFASGDFEYIGLDKVLPPGSDVICNRDPIFSFCDFENAKWMGNMCPYSFDVFVGFEIIEHLNDEGVIHFLRLARQAKERIIISTPIVPNSNPYHKQQFRPLSIPAFFAASKTWALEYSIVQNDIYGIFIFKNAYGKQQ